MGYYIDLKKVSLEDYKSKLAKAYLPPSRMMLRERLDERFDCFTQISIRNVQELLQTLKKKSHFAGLSKIECLSGDYLTILLRELNSTLPKPNKLKDFVGISCEAVTQLEKMGIKDTFRLYDKIKTPAHRKQLAKDIGVSEEEILELTKLTDLSRIKWVGVNFARMLYDVGVDTVEKAANASDTDLHQRINQINKEMNVYRGSIGLNDIRIFIDAAKEVPQEIDYSV
jgi:hypothetical protein